MGPDLAEISQFLDTQVSLAPTHVSWSVRWSHFLISNLWSVTVDQIKKVQKTKCIYFRILLLGGPVNWSPTHSTGPQPIQLVPKNCFLQKSQYRSLKSKRLKNLVHLFSNFDSGRTSQLVPNPFNWYPKTVFYRNLSIGRSNKKIQKT